MMKRCKNVIAILLALSMVSASFSSDFAMANAYAVESNEELEDLKDRDIATVEWEKVNTEDDSTLQVSGESVNSGEDESTDVAAATISSNDQSVSEISKEGASNAGEQHSDSSEDASSAGSSNDASSAGSSNDTSSAGSSNDTSSAADASASSSSSIEAEIESTSDASAEKSSVEENLVSISYKATKGGNVSKTKETIDLNNKESVPEGATATPWNDKYVFTYWTDENGNQVSTEASFVPGEVTEDTTFIANFSSVETISDTMPVIEVSDVHEGGLVVSVNAEEGLFPAGTEVVITAISDTQAIDTAKDTLGEHVTAAKGVDIKFVYEGNEIQPADSKYVHVALSLEEVIEGDSFTVLHEHEGNVTEIENASLSTEEANSDPADETQVVTAAEFDVNQFSIFIIAGTGEDSSTDTDDGRAVATYKFYKKAYEAEDNEVIFEKIVKAGDNVSNPGIPLIEDNQEFIGWYIYDSEGTRKEQVSFDKKTNLYTVAHVEQNSTVNIYPVVRSTYYVTFFGTDGEIHRVEKVVVESDEDKKLDITGSEFSITALAGTAFKGWSTEKDNPDKIVEYVDVTQGPLILYPIIVEAYWVRFQGNVTGQSGATYTGPVYIEHGQTLQDALNKVKGNPERTGYDFLGWSFENKVDNTVLTDADKQTKIEDIAAVDQDKAELYLYAVWKAKEKTKVTIIEWHQNSIDLEKYDFAVNTVVEGVTTGSTISVKEKNGKVIISTSADNTIKEISKFDTGFEYDSSIAVPYTIKDGSANNTTIAGASGDTVINIYEQRKKITFTYYIAKDVKYNRTTDYYGDLFGTVKGKYVRIYFHGGLINQYFYYIGEDGTLIKYNGNRYTRKVGSWEEYKVFESRYGVTLKNAGYTWPSEYEWHVEKNDSGPTGTHETFVDAFLEDRVFYGIDEGYSTNYFYHFKQDVDGNYDLDNPDITVSGGSGGFIFTDKFKAFSVTRYLIGGSITNRDVNSWSECHDEEKNPDGNGVTSVAGNTYQNIYILHERHKYNLTLKVFDPISGLENVSASSVVTGIPYEQVLNTNSGVVPYATEGYTPGDIQGYEFGWYKDPAGTEKFDFSIEMPDGGVVVYGIYKPVKYTVTLHSEGGKYVNQLKPDAELGDPEISRFKIWCYEEVDRNNLLTGVEKEDYKLLGWYYADGSEFKYGRVTSNIDLYAHWTYKGVVKVLYDAGTHGLFDDDTNQFVPEYNYSSGCSVVVAAPPTKIINDVQNKKYYTFIGWRIRGVDSEIYYPNDVFTTTDEIIKASDYTVGKVKYVIVDAVYKETGGPGGEDEKTFIIYDPNDGDAGQARIVKESLIVNKAEQALGATFTKKGYRQVSWNTMPDGTGLEVPFGTKYIAADNVDRSITKNSDDNILYAIYEPVKLIIEIQGSSATYTYDGTSKSNNVFSVKRAYYKDESDNEVIVNGVTKDNIVYNGNAVTGTNVNHKGDNIVPYEKYLEIKDFQAVNTGYEVYEIVIDSDNSSFKLTINPVEIKVKTSSKEKEYDGTPLTSPEATIEGLVNNETATVTATGTITEVGDTDNTYDEIVWGTASQYNYTVKDELGKLKINKNSKLVKLIAASDSKTYDSTALVKNVVTPEGLPTGFTVEAEAEGSRTDAGESDNIVKDGYVIKDAAGNDKTANFTNVRKEKGKLVVNKRPVKIETGSDSKQYDGLPLTCDTISFKGFVPSEEKLLTIKTTGSQTEVGDSDNTYDITWGNVKKENYDISDTLGKLTVTKSDVEVILTAASDSKIYDGKALKNTAVSDKGLPTGFTVEAEAEGSQTDVGESVNKVKDGYVIKDASGADKTSNFTKVKKVDGKLEVTKAKLSIITGSDSKEYDGTPLTNDDVKIEGLVNNETIVVKTTGTITEVGTTENGYEIKWETAKEENYLVSDSIGKLEIYKNGNAVILEAVSDSKTYDGEELKNDKVDVTGLPDGFTVVAKAEGSQKNVGESENVVAKDYVIKNAAGQDKTANFTNIITKSGILKVTKRKVTLLSGSAKKKYDGTPLVYNKVDVIEGAFVKGEGYTANVTGSQTLIGESNNEYTIAFNDGTNAQNYEIVTRTGKLEVVGRSEDEKFVVTGNVEDVTRPYSGLLYSNFDYSLKAEGNSSVVDIVTNAVNTVIDYVQDIFTLQAGADMDGNTITDVSVGEAGFKVSGIYVSTAETDAGEYAMVLSSDGFTVKDENGNDVTSQFTYRDGSLGKLTITRIPLTVTTESATKTYDGSPLTNSTTTVTGLVNGETATAIATGSQTEVGSSVNNYNIIWGTAKESNYVVTDTLGTLTVNPTIIPDVPTPDPTPTPTPGPTPDPGTPTATPTPAAPAVPANPVATPVQVADQAVLGARREAGSTGDGQAVLGARRSKTEDETNDTARMITVVVSAAAAVALLFMGKRKKENEEQ